MKRFNISIGKNWLNKKNRNGSFGIEVNGGRKIEKFKEKEKLVNKPNDFR